MHASRLVEAIALCGLVAMNGCAGSEPEDSAAAGEASSALAASGIQGRSRCAVKDPDPVTQDATEAEVAAAKVQRAMSGFWGGGGRITVPVHFHIVTTSDGAFGDVSSLVPDQLDVLDAAYAHARVRFHLASLEVVPNDAWFFSALGSPEEVEMKAALRLGGADDLNLYTTLGDVYLGWATFPRDYHRNKTYDGVVVYYATLPGGGLSFPYDPAFEPDGIITYDLGDTGTHEVGHWLGLYHTFEGGCSNKNDRVDDTPAEAEPQFFCATRDSCTGRKFPGLDPIHNFMDYVDDVCMDEFTRGQESRMRDQWDTYRD